MSSTYGNDIQFRQSLAIWRAKLRSLRNMRHYGSRLRVGIGISLVFSLALGIWSSYRLYIVIQQWQASGLAAVTNGLWLLCLGVWGGIGVVAGFGLQNALLSDEALLLFTSPVTPAERFRALYGSFFLSNSWLLTLLQAVVTGYVLFSTLGWKALLWLAVLQLGVIVMVGGTLLLTLLVMRYLLPSGHGKQRSIVAGIASVIILLVMVFRGTFARDGVVLLTQWCRPEFVLVLLILMFILLVGPCASISGNLYQEAVLLRQSQDRARKANTLPGVGLLSTLMRRRRSLIGALFVRSIINQSRNWLFWGRLVVIYSLLALFPLLHAALHQHGFTDTVLIAGYAALLAVGHIIETAPGAISGEANRLALYLIAPLEFVHILWAKLVLFLLPTLIEALVLGLFLCRWTGLALSQVGSVLLLIPLIVLPCTALLVWGSVWDENLNQSVEGRADTLLLEEGPFSPRKMLLLYLCLLCLVAIFLALWQLPFVLALLILILCNVIFILGMQRLSVAELQRLLQRG